LDVLAYPVHRAGSVAEADTKVRRVELTQADSGGRYAAPVGEDLTIVLAENPTTGYIWHADIDPRALQQIDDSYVGPTEPRGAAGTRRLTFRVLRPGPIHLRVVNRRPWEDAAAEELHFDIEAT
jgi:predicted secreted protein